MTLYLHIGIPKTGTTSIQQFLRHNRSALLHQGYLYPGLGVNIIDHRLVWAQSDDRITERLLEQLRRECVDSGAPHVIISAEILHARWTSRDQAASVRDQVSRLGCQDVRVIVYLREQVSLLCSQLSQDLRAGRCGWRRLQVMPPQDNPRRQRMDHRHTLECWGEAFGRENLCVRIFAPDALEHGDLLCDFTAALDLPAPGELTRPQGQHANQSLNLLAMRLLGGFNDMLAEHGLDPQKAVAERGCLMSLLDRHLMALNSDPALRYTPPRDVCEAYEEYYAATNEWVRRTFFPQRERLFSPRDYSRWSEHTSPEQLQPQAWQALAQLLGAAVLQITRTRPAP